VRLWSCKADGKTKEEVEKELKFSLSEYCDDEVRLGLTQEEMVKKLQRFRARCYRLSSHLVRRVDAMGRVQTVLLRRVRGEGE
jgi:hypothetical protein